jgi:nitrous oxidase accessory protein
LLLILAALSLAATFVTPLWRIDLQAPQYPEGIGIRIWTHTITGAGEYDLKKINQLNHYIGMKAIQPDSIRELDVMPWVVGALMISGILIAALGRRWLLYAWTGLFGVTALAGLVDFWRWEYDYGHNLNPEAAIKIPGMSYQPPLIGSRDILNFTAHSWPAIGGIAAFAAFGFAIAAVINEWHARRRASPAPVTPTDAKRAGARTAAPVVLCSVSLLSWGCSPGPEPIVYGQDQGAYCRMTITDERYGAELVMRTGKVLKFDSIECLAGYFLERADTPNIHSIWVTAFNDPPTLVRVQDAFFLESRDLRSPMSRNLTAFGAGITRNAVRNSFFGQILTWDDVLDRVRSNDVAAAPTAFDIVTRHQSADEPSPNATLRVSPDGPIRTITEAVARAESGSRIIVGPGTYREPPIVIDKAVEIVGEMDPVLDGENDHQIMIITADGVTVRGLVFRDVGTSYVEDRSAIRVENASACRIERNRLENTFFGIYLARTHDCVIVDNVLHAGRERETASGNGIHVWNSRNVHIRGNEVRGHRDGIYFEFVEESRVEENLSEGNLRYGLHFMFSDSCHYVKNTFRANGAGVAVMYAKNVEMQDNVFELNWGTAAFGLLLKDIRDSRIEGNVFRGNSVAMWAEGSNRVHIEGNLFAENGWAVKIMANSLDNIFTHNDFVGNTFDVATNSRQSYSSFRENWWDAYRGYDLDRDGYGDVPFRPVRLFALVVEHNEPSLVLLRSLLVSVLDAAERVLPVLTPETLSDDRPLMHPASSLAGPAKGNAAVATAGRTK